MCNCTSFVGKRNCHLPIYSTPIVGFKLSHVIARRIVTSNQLGNTLQTLFFSGLATDSQNSVKHLPTDTQQAVGQGWANCGSLNSFYGLLIHHSHF